MGIRTAERTLRVNSVWGVNPPSWRLAHNSRRCAPPRSAAVARSRVSTATSSRKPVGIVSSEDATRQEETASAGTHAPFYGRLPPSALKNASVVSPRVARCVRLLAESSSLIPPIILQGLSDKETKNEDTQIYFCRRLCSDGDCYRLLREAVPPAGGALCPSNRQCELALLAGSPSRADRYRQDGGREGRDGRASHPFAQRRVKCVSEGGRAKSRRHHGFGQRPRVIQGVHQQSCFAGNPGDLHGFGLARFTPRAFHRDG